MSDGSDRLTRDRAAMAAGTVEGDQDPDRRREGFIRSDDNLTPLVLELLRLAMDSKSLSTASTTSRGNKTKRKATKKELKATGSRERAKPQRNPPKVKPRVTFNTKSTTKSKVMVHGKNKTAKRPFLQQRKRSKTDLNVAIRKFSASKVKIPKRNTRWARKMADTHIEFIRKYCQEKSKGILNHFEFTGSFYEHLKAEDANELDILVALDTKDNAHLIVEEVVPGYARIKVTKKSSKYWRFVEDSGGYVRPAKVRSWFFGLVQQAVNQYKSNKNEKDPLIKPSDNGPAAKLLIDDKEEKKKLEVDLVPAFLFKPKKVRGSIAVPAEGRHYVAKQLPQRMITKDLKCSREMLWRQSFSLQEKKKMENLDKKDSGCRREVVKVLKTIVKNDSTLAKLSSYHIKTAFLHYNFDKGQEDLEWSAQHLAERLKGLMEYLRHNISERRLSHFFINELDLLMELSDDTLANIEGRLNKLINNESELRRALTVQPENLNNEAKTTKKKSKKKTKKSNTEQGHQK